ncbi:MAG: BlaI/MecI/CopY family transcriptional regulator [Prevotella sp.]
MKHKNSERTLTRAEMEVMNILWSSGRNMTTNQVVDSFPEPQPAYTTIATFLKILSAKGFVGHNRQQGSKAFCFFPLISRAEYTRQVMENIKNTFFGGSGKSLMSFFIKEEHLSDNEIKELLNMIKE